MKILYTNAHKVNGGGHVSYIMALVEGLSQDHQCDVATPSTSRLYRFASALQNKNVHVYGQLFPKTFFELKRDIRPLRALIAEQGYDIIHTNCPADHRAVILACKGLNFKPKIIYTKHNTNSVRSLGNWWRAKKTDAVITVSNYVRGMLSQSAYQHVPLEMIYLGTDTHRFSPPTPDEKQALRQQLLGIDDPRIVVFGSSGGTDIEKGWFDLVKAVSQLPKSLQERCRILVAGSLPKTSTMQQIAQLGMGDTVIFPGLVDNIQDYLATCDVGFLLSYKEAFPYATRETMSMGLPTLVSNAGGLPEIVDHQANGWVIPVGHIPSIQAVVQHILEQPDSLAKMGQLAQKTVAQRFNMPKFIQQTLDCYQRTLNL